VAFALAAIVSPRTHRSIRDHARVPIPRRLMHVLEGESLLKRCLGSWFSCVRGRSGFGRDVLPVDALATFLWLAIGGIAFGVSVTRIADRREELGIEHFGEETGSQILISLLIPFGAYLLAEHFRCSGICRRRPPASP